MKIVSECRGAVKAVYSPSGRTVHTSMCRPGLENVPVSPKIANRPNEAV